MCFQSHSLVRGNERVVSSSVGGRNAGNRRWFPHSIVHGHGQYRHRLRRSSRRLGHRSREIHQRWLRMVGDSHSSICYSRRTVQTVSRFVVYFDAAFVSAKQALINVYNPNDHMCFAWAVLSALYPCKTHGKNLQVPPAFEFDRFIWNYISYTRSPNKPFRKEQSNNFYQRVCAWRR
jgi:hypothetical protein